MGKGKKKILTLLDSEDQPMLQNYNSQTLDGLDGDHNLVTERDIS